MRKKHKPNPKEGERTPWTKKFAWLPTTIWGFHTVDGVTQTDYDNKHTVWLESYWEQKEAYYGKTLNKFGMVISNCLKWRTRRVLNDQYNVLTMLK
jgi:hypothetical protein